MKRLFVFLTLIIGLCTGCTKTSEPKISTDVDKVTMGFEGGEATVSVICDVVTRCRIDYDGEVTDWITLEPKSLPGSGELKLVISKNEAYQTPRTASLVIVAPDRKAVVTIEQEGNPNEPPTLLKIDRKYFSVDVEGGKYDVNITSDGKWTAVSNQDWCKVNNASGEGNGKFTIDVERSKDYQYRTAEITVKAGNADPQVIAVEHVGTKIGDLVWANANVNEPDTFCDNREGRGKLYQWNSKFCYESGSKDDHLDPVTLPADYEAPDKVEKLKGLEWKEENNPCPDGWRVPTIEELRTLLDASKGTDGKWIVNNSWYDFDKVNGMSVAGAYAGLPLKELKKCTKERMDGAIFLPQAGTIYAQSGQTDWWSIRLWSSSNFGPGDVYAKFSVNIATYGVDPSYWTEVKESASVRCVRK